MYTNTNAMPAPRLPRTTILTSFPLAKASTQTELLRAYPAAIARRLTPEHAALLFTLTQRFGVIFRVPRVPDRPWRTPVLWHQDKPLAVPERSRALKSINRRVTVSQRQRVRRAD